jgi:transposase
MSATHTNQSTPTRAPVLYLAIELSGHSWKLAFTVGLGQKPRLRTISAGNTAQLILEISKAKDRFNLPEGTAVISCYEAGRDGFWLHRFLVHQGIENLVVDSASIEVNRRKRRAKSDGLDATKLVEMLIRWHNGERKVWRVVKVPSAQDEDNRQPHRDLMQLKGQRTEHVNRIKGLLAAVGLRIKVDATLPQQWDQLRQWDDQPVPEHLRQRILREFQQWQLVCRQIHDLELQRSKDIRTDSTAAGDKMRQLLQLKGIGETGAQVLVREIFGWRQIKNVRELGSLAGLTPTPYDSGGSRSEQGISKAGNRRVRWLLLELAWGWLRYQPCSELSRWFRRRFGEGNSRLRKVGIVAVARKLLIALWKYLELGMVPAGAVLRESKKAGALKQAS